MEHNEILYIKENLSRLLEVTICNEDLVARLMSSGILTISDVVKMDTTLSTTPKSRAEKLYEFLQSRAGSYRPLVTALRDTNQLAAFKILKTFLNNPYTVRKQTRQKPATKYKYAPEGVRSFLEKSKPHILIITCFDRAITLHKLQDGSDELINIIDEKSIKTVPTKRNHINVVSAINLGGLLKTLEILHEKIVVITEEDYTATQEAVRKLRNHNSIRVTSDEMRWSDLTENFQTEIINSRVVLQHGCELKLRDVFDAMGIGYTEKSRIGKLLNGRFLISLINKRRTEIMKHALPARLECYVERRLSSRCYVAAETIGKAAGSDHYLIKGITRQGLVELFPNFIIDISSNQLKLSCITTRFILLETMDHFGEICKLIPEQEPVHVLHYEMGQLMWITSRGSMTTIQCSLSGIQEEYDEDEFSEHLQETATTPIIISGPPGMGKSVFLGEIGRRILSQKRADDVVAFMPISELLKKATGGGDPRSATHLLQFLSSYTSSCELGEILLKSTLTSGKKTLHLLLDGYDELECPDMEVINKCLQQLMLIFPSIRIYVSTQPHFLHELEATLKVFGYNIQPLSESEQLQILVSYWRIANSSAEDSVPKLTEFGRGCLKMCKDEGVTSSSDIEDDETFTGNPLHCFIVGRTLAHEALQYLELSLEQTQALSDLATILSQKRFELFENMVTVKLQRHMSNNTKAIMVSHAYEAIFLLFDKLILEETEQISRDSLMKFGILLHSSSETLSFVHTSVAHYLIAWFVLEVLSGSTIAQPILDFLFNVILELDVVDDDDEMNRQLHRTLNLSAFTFKHKAILQYLNHHILHASYNSVAILFMRRTNILKHLALACAYDNLENLFVYLLNSKGFHSLETIIFDQELLQVAIMRSSVSFINIVVENFKRWSGKQLHEVEIRYDHTSCSFLHLAALRGDYVVLEYLIAHQGFGKLLQEGNPSCKFLLHFCLLGTNQQLVTQKAIMDRIHLIRLFLSINTAILEEANESGITPILSPSIHIQLLKELIHLGANVLAQNNDGYTVIHIAAEYLGPDEFHELVSTISVSSLATLLTMKDNQKGRTPLHRMLFYFDPPMSTLELFRSCGTDFNAVDAESNSALVLAIKNHRSIDLLQALVDYGANWKYANSKGKSVLHVAAWEGNFNAVTYFVQLGQDTNARDMYGNTALHYATLHNREERGKVIDFLVKNGADVNARNAQNLTPLWHAFNVKPKQLELTIIEQLLEAGAVCTSEIATLAVKLVVLDGAPVARGHANCGIQSGGKSPIKFLKECLDRGAVLSPRDAEGRSLLHVVAQRGWVDIIKLLLEYCMDVNGRDGQMNTPLHYAFHADNQAEVVKCLVEHKAAVNVINQNGQTPLHYALVNKLPLDLSTLTTLKLHGVLCNPEIATLCLAWLVVDESADTRWYLLAKTCLQAKADLHGRNDQGTTLLHEAAGVRNVNGVKFLILSGANVNAANGDGETVLTSIRCYKKDAERHKVEHVCEKKEKCNKVIWLLLHHQSFKTKYDAKKRLNHNIRAAAAAQQLSKSPNKSPRAEKVVGQVNGGPKLGNGIRFSVQSQRRLLR